MPINMQIEYPKLVAENTTLKMENEELKKKLKGMIPRSVAFSIANRFYGSDYNMEQQTFDNAAKDLGY